MRKRAADYPTFLIAATDGELSRVAWEQFFARIEVMKTQRRER